MTALVVLLFGVGYPVSVTVIARWLPVVRERRWRWFTAHEFGVLAIVVGWAIRGLWTAVAVNAVWFIVAGLWYLGSGPRYRPADHDRGD